MNTDELMIGDKVFFRSLPDSKPRCYRWYYYDYKDTNDEYVEPIPLTIRMLESNGWLHHPSGDPTDGELRTPEDVCFKEPLVLRYHEGSDAFWWGVGTFEMLRPVRYVHELQHILRSCGLRKMADNFEIE